MQWSVNRSLALLSSCTRLPRHSAVLFLLCSAQVNAANGGMWAGGGICGAIHKAAGPQLEADSVGWVKKHGHVGTGETLVTPAYNLPCSLRLPHGSDTGTAAAGR